MLAKTLLKGSCLSIILFVVLSQHVYSQEFDYTLKFSPDKYGEAELIDPFKVTDVTDKHPALNAVTKLNLSKEFLSNTTENQSQQLYLRIPLDERTSIDVFLEEADFLADDFELKYASGDHGPDIDDNKYYWGKVVGEEVSIASMTVTKNEIISVISIGDKVYNLGKLTNEDAYVIYEKNSLKSPPETNCFSEDLPEFKSDKIEQRSAGNPDNCVKMYVEVDHDIYVSKGSNTAAYITGVFSQVSQLYLNESINLQLGELLIWDTEDPYVGPETNKFLTQFRDRLSGNFNGDLAHLVGNKGSGGIAYINTLCNSYYSVAYSDINASYSTVPTYSWTVEVLTHEIGHNLGSPHTHSCSWNGNNTQLDDCGNIYLSNVNGSPGSCYDPNNQIVPESGTVMSYCHLVSGIGIDFNKGFGIQPGDLIRSRVYNATCLQTCGSSCQSGNSCDDGDMCTINDTYDADCNCVGVYQDTDGDSVCDAQDLCPGFNDALDSDADGTPDGCDDCQGTYVDFSSSTLAHSGEGSSSSIATFSSITTESSFTISGLNSRINGRQSGRYIEKAVVSYKDRNGINKVHSTYVGTGESTVNVFIEEEHSQITVTLSDDYDGYSNVNMLFNLSAISSCPSTECPDSDQDGVCDADDVCPGGDDSIDTNGNGIPDACDNYCEKVSRNFATNPLSHKGAGSSQATFDFQPGDQDVSFNITGINAVLKGKPADRYLDEVTVYYLDAAGDTQIYGTYRGSDLSWVTVTIPGEVSKVIVSLRDAYSGAASSTISVGLSSIIYCTLSSIDENPVVIEKSKRARIYPNPFKDVVNVSLENIEFEKYEVEVYDMMGRQVMKPRTGISPEIQLDLPTLEGGGVFIVKVRTDKGEEFLKQIVSIN